MELPVTNQPVKHTDPKQERNDKIRLMYQEGITLQAIAEHYGISYQRVHQIIHFRRK